MRVGNSKISSDVGSNPVSNIRLVHRIHVNFVFAWTWHVEVLCPHCSLHSKAELRILATSIVRSSRISEVEITSDLVVAWPWHSQVLSSLFASLSDFSVLLIFIDRTFAISPSVAERSKFVRVAGILFFLARVFLTFECITWVY